MSYIFNTDFFSMKRKDNKEVAPEQLVSLSSALLAQSGEGDVVYGDPTDFDMKDEVNQFDHGWDLDMDAKSFRRGEYFQGMR